MDKFETQSGGHVKEGHEEGDISIKGIVWSGVFLVISAFFGLCAHDRHDSHFGELGEES